MERPGWKVRDRTPLLGDHDIHVWWGQPEDVRRWHQELLDPVEQARHAKLRQPMDRDRFVVACALLRLAVGTYVGRSPHNISLVRTCPDCAQPHGKPRVADDSELELSLSHAGGRVVVVVARRSPVGVDVEKITKLRDTERLAPRVLAPRESASFSALPTERRHSALLTYWTRKEAVLKATGDGLRVPPNHLVVSDPHEEPRLLEWQGRSNVVSKINLYRLDAGSDHVGSLAVIGTGNRHVVQLDGLMLLGHPAPAE